VIVTQSGNTDDSCIATDENARNVVVHAHVHIHCFNSESQQSIHKEYTCCNEMDAIPSSFSRLHGFESHRDPSVMTLDCCIGFKTQYPVHVLFFFNRASRHEVVLEEWWYSSMHSSPRHEMEVSGQLHAPAALPLGKESLLLIG
jgi:hypothetical protein